ncbi:MAG: DUF935 domain-containing protein [Pseudomonadota bacterium]
MANKPVLLDYLGRPVRRTELKKEVAAATVGGVRSPVSGYPGDGLTPDRLGHILRSADQGDMLQYLELAETIEERDLHYQGIIGTRRRAVSQIEISVEAGSDDKMHERQAEELRKWLKRAELTDELFDILDAIPKGFSFTEIIWDTSEGQWQPALLERRDPRWFRFKREDLLTPMMLSKQGQELPLPAFKFIYPRINAKSGLPIRSGIARSAMWAYLFKAYTARDWAIFTQTYGQPLRVGKWGPGASEADKDTLFTAVANIAGDCAAIIPESMSIDFVEASNVGASTGLFKERADWLDMQMSKAVLGQTATTDSVTGGLGSGDEHGDVREDIKCADAKSLAAVLTRDLAIPFVQLNHGPQQHYPQIKIEDPEPEDLAALSSALQTLVPLGMRVKEEEVRNKFGLSEPGPDDRILGETDPKAPADPQNPNLPGVETGGTRRESEFKHPFNTLLAKLGPGGALQSSEALSGPLSGSAPEDDLVDLALDVTQATREEQIETLEAMMESANSLEEFGQMLRAAFPNLENAAVTSVIGDALLAAFVGGQLLTVDESG